MIQKIERIERLKELTPAAFRKIEEGAEDGVSKDYKFITTSEIIDILNSLGWVVYSGTQQKSKKNPETTKHMLRFRNMKFGVYGINGNVPEILLVNSHDRTTSLNFYVSIFQPIRSNGSVISNNVFNKYVVKHEVMLNAEGNDITSDHIKEIIMDITKKLPKIFTYIDEFSKILLTEEQQKELVMRCLTARYPEYVDPKTDNLLISKIINEISIDELLKPIHDEDYSNDLWTVFNKIQEKMVKGGFKKVWENGKVKATRSINNIKLDILVKTKLWVIVEQFILTVGEKNTNEVEHSL